MLEDPIGKKLEEMLRKHDYTPKYQVEVMGREISSVAICTMDSLYSMFILGNLSDSEYQKIKLIIISDRYNGKHGTFFEQLMHNTLRSGLSFVCYLSYIFVCHKILYFFRGNLRTIRQTARSKNIPILTVPDINNAFIVDTLKRIKPDLMISFYFDQLFKKQIYSVPRIGTINIHPGPLPEYRGPFPTFWLLYHGRRESAISAHKVDDKFDTGDLIYTENVILPNTCTVLGADRIISSQIPAVIAKLLRGEINFSGVVQRREKAKYYSFPTRNDLKKAKLVGLRLGSIPDYFSFGRK